MTAFPPDAEVGEVVIHEVIDGRKFPAVPDQVQEPANDRAVVLLESHKAFPPCLLPGRLPAGPESAPCLARDGGQPGDRGVKGVIRLVRHDAWWQVGLHVAVEPALAVLFGFPDPDDPPPASRIGPARMADKALEARMRGVSCEAIPA